MWHLLTGDQYESGLDAVYEQKALGDANYTTERRVHAALIEDKEFRPPTFED